MFREQWIIDAISKKSVLDIGSVGQSTIYSLWSIMSPFALDLTGVDLPDAEKIASSELALALSNNDDARIRRGNMENINLGRQFDVIVAGDVLEHVSNAGLFLDNCKKHLNANGKLILTTPNAKWVTVLLTPNKTHTCWYDIFTLESLLHRHGFKISESRYYCGNKPYYNFFLQQFLRRQQIYVEATLY